MNGSHVLLPPLFGAILLVAGAVAAAAADAWLVFALSAGIGAAVPLAYTRQLAREQRLFLRGDASRTRSRFRFVGWLVGAAAIVVLGSVGGSGTAAIYGGLGGAALGIWPGLLANFMRLWHEEWAPTRSH